MILIYLLVGYLVIVWGILPLVVPHLSTRKRPIPKSVPSYIEEFIKEIKVEHYSQEEGLRRTYDFVTNRYYGSRLGTIFFFWRAFIDPFHFSSGFMHCTGQNFILRTILVRSDLFPEKNIRIVLRPLNLFVHQHLRIFLNGKWVKIDPWAKSIGVPYKSTTPPIG